MKAEDLFPRPANADPWYYVDIHWERRGFVREDISQDGRKGDRCGEC